MKTEVSGSPIASDLQASISVKNILVPLDFSRASMHALDYATALAEQFKAQIHLVHVQMPDEARVFSVQEFLTGSKTDFSNFWQSQSWSSFGKQRNICHQLKCFCVMLHSAKTNVCLFRLSLQWTVRFL